MLHRLTLIVVALAALHSLTLASVEAQSPPRNPLNPTSQQGSRVEVRVWQHVADPLRIYISARGPRRFVEHARDNPTPARRRLQRQR